MVTIVVWAESWRRYPDVCSRKYAIPDADPTIDLRDGVFRWMAASYRCKLLYSTMPPLYWPLCRTYTLEHCLPGIIGRDARGRNVVACLIIDASLALSGVLGKEGEKIPSFPQHSDIGQATNRSKPLAILSFPNRNDISVDYLRKEINASFGSFFPWCTSCQLSFSSGLSNLLTRDAIIIREIPRSDNSGPQEVSSSGGLKAYNHQSPRIRKLSEIAD